VPTFAEYIPIVSAAVTDGTRRVYGTYWNRIDEHWGHRHLDEPTPSEIKQLVEHVKVNVVTRRNARGGRSAGEHPGDHPPGPGVLPAARHRRAGAAAADPAIQNRPGTAATR
jgi:hypothetical protein